MGTRRRRAKVIGFFMGLISAAFGCDGSSPLFPVEGEVTYEGKPLATGGVVFFPEDGQALSADRVPRGQIDDRGRYRILTGGRMGAPAGAYRVAVVAQSRTRPPNTPANLLGVYPLIPQSYFSEATTPLRVEVSPSAAAGSYELKLAR